MFNETWLNLYNERSVGSTDYSFVAVKNRTSRKGGGVAILSKSGTIIGNEIDCNVFESVGSEVYLNKKLIEVYSINIPTQSPKKDVIHCLDLFLEKISTRNKSDLITGDFNIDILKEEKIRREYENSVKSNGFRLLNRTPSRVTISCKTCIDHVLTNLSYNIPDSEVLNDVISDHYPIITKIGLENNTKSVTSIRNYSLFHNSQNLTSFLDCLQTSLDSAYFTSGGDPNRNFSLFHLTLLRVFNSYFPLTVNTKERPWITNRIKNLMSKRNNAHKNG